VYTNIGKKIKVLAQVFTWVGIIGSVIMGIFLITLSSPREVEVRQGGGYFTPSTTRTETVFEPSMIVVGLVVSIGGSLSSWVSSFVLYGFGELIETNAEIVRNTAKGLSGDTLTVKTENHETTKPTDDRWKCQACCCLNIADKTECWKCETKKAEDSEEWSCRDCKQLNDKEAYRCKECGTFKVDI